MRTMWLQGIVISHYLGKSFFEQNKRTHNLVRIFFFPFHRTSHCDVSVQKCCSASGCFWSFLPSSLSTHVFIFCGVDFPLCGGKIADVDTCMTGALHRELQIVLL